MAFLNYIFAILNLSGQTFYSVETCGKFLTSKTFHLKQSNALSHRRGRGYESERPRYDGPAATVVAAPLSYEAAVALGRGGGARALPSPATGRMPNGYKPRPRHSDSDEDDWC